MRELATQEQMNADPQWHGGLKCSCGHNYGFHFIHVFMSPCQFKGCGCPGWMGDAEATKRDAEKLARLNAMCGGGLVKEETMAKAKADALDLKEVGMDLSLERLMETFRALAEGVEAQLAAENEEGLAAARGESAKALEAVITEETARRDQLVELMAAVEERAQRIRKTVQSAEKIARHYEAFVKGINYSVQLYMTEKGISEINGKFHRFKLQGQPDAMQLDENNIPMDYRKFPLEHRMAEVLREARVAILTMLKSVASEFALNPEAYPMVGKIDRILAEVPAETALGTPDKDKIEAALKAKRDVPGAALLTNRKRLDIK